MNINDIIRKPIITEKTYDDMSLNKYTFEVHRDATKTDIKTGLGLWLHQDQINESANCYSMPT